MKAWRRQCTVTKGGEAGPSCHRVLSVTGDGTTARWEFDGAPLGVVDVGLMFVDGVGGRGLLVVEDTHIDVEMDFPVTPGMVWSLGAAGITFEDGQPACEGQSGLVS